MNKRQGVSPATPASTPPGRTDKALAGRLPAPAQARRAPLTFDPLSSTLGPGKLCTSCGVGVHTPPRVLTAPH